MSIRTKTFCIITAIVIVITASSMIISITSAQGQILQTLENDMLLVATLANEYVSGEIDLLKANASTVAQLLKTTGFMQTQLVLMEQVAAYSDYFTAITIFNNDGGIDASFGTAPAPVEMAHGRYGQQAFAGHRVMSSSRMDDSGNLVFHVFVPMDDYHFRAIIGDPDPNPKIIACTVPGDYFSKRVSRFQIWDTGNITMVDSEGIIIANVQNQLVTDRLDLTYLAQQEKQINDAVRVMQRMISGEFSADRFMANGSDAVVAFMPISASHDRWSIAVIAPVTESPFNNIFTILLISGLAVMGLGLIAAAFASGIIIKLIKNTE